MADFHQNVDRTLAGGLDRAFTEFQDHPFGSPTIPEWRRIEVALDGVLPELVNAFEHPSGVTDAIAPSGQA